MTSPDAQPRTDASGVTHWACPLPVPGSSAKSPQCVATARNVAEIALARCVARWPAQSASVTLVTSWFSNRRAWVLSHAWSPGNGGPAFRRRRGDHVGRGLGCTAAHMRRSSLRVHNGRSGDARGDSEIVLRSGSMEPQQRACGTPCKA